MFRTILTREPDGTLPAFTWPGGYPLYYLCADGGTLCPACANGENGSEASEAADAPADWRLVAQDVHWEGPPLSCDHCGAAVESAYGDPDARRGETDGTLDEAERRALHPEEYES
jgi:hypothetical protein